MEISLPEVIKVPFNFLIDYFKKKNLEEAFYNTMAGCRCKNYYFDTFKVAKITKEVYGFSVELQTPWGLSYKDLDSNIEALKAGLKCNNIIYTVYENKNTIKLKVIKKNFKKIDFTPIEVKTHELYVGLEPDLKPLKISMKENVHLLVAGISNSGKSMLIIITLVNLLYYFDDSKVQLYLSQIAKNDIDTFVNYVNTKYFATNLEETKKMLIEIQSIVEKRDKLFRQNKVSNIYEYNNMFKDYQLPFIYIYIDEFAFYMPNASDDKETVKPLKASIVAMIDKAILVWRAYGIYLLGGVQYAVKENFPQTAKQQMTAISFKQKDDVGSRVILNNSLAVGLGKQEAVAALYENVFFKTPYLTKDMIDELLKHRLKENISKESQYKAQDVDLNEKGIISHPINLNHSEGIREPINNVNNEMLDITVRDPLEIARIKRNLLKQGRRKKK